jgi:hypothetical protein
MMKRIPGRDELTPSEFLSLCLAAEAFMSRMIPSSERKHLVELGLIQETMGGLMPSLAGTIVSRS